LSVDACDFARQRRLKRPARKTHARNLGLTTTDGQGEEAPEHKAKLLELIG
jgi:hypothetical protein